MGDRTIAPGTGRPCASTTRPCKGLRGESRTTCGGISAGTRSNCANAGESIGLDHHRELAPFRVDERPGAEPPVPVGLDAPERRPVRPRLDDDRGAGDRPAGRAQDRAGEGSAGLHHPVGREGAEGLGGDGLLEPDVVGMRRHELEPDVGPRRGGQGLGPPSALVVGDRGGDVALRVRVSLAPPRGGAAPTCKCTRAPAIGRPWSSRTVPPIGTPRSRATVYGLGDRLVAVPSKLDGRETAMDDDHLEERSRPGRDRDRVATLLVGLALRHERPAPVDLRPNECVAQSGVVRFAHDLQCQGAGRLRFLIWGRLRRLSGGRRIGLGSNHSSRSGGAA